VQAAELDEHLVIEAAAFVSEVVRRKTPLIAPVPSESVAQLTADIDDEESEADVLGFLATLDECVIDISGRTIQLLPDRPIQAPALRLFSANRPRAIVLTEAEDDLFIAQVPDDLHGDVSVQLVGEHLSTSAPRDTTILVVPPAPWVPSSPRPVDSLRGLGNALIDNLVDQVFQAVVQQRPIDAPTEELFDDEVAAAEALSRFADRTDDLGAIDQVAMAVAPAAFLFSSFRLDDHTLSRLRSKSWLMYAALAPRTPRAWTPLGWPPNARFDASTEASSAFVRWVRTHTHQPDAPPPTWRYPAAETTHSALANLCVSRLAANDVDRSTLDLMIAADCLLGNDRVSDEALRMILTARQTESRTAERGVLAGFLLHLLSRGRT
jgi:hypothetical protein